MTIMFFFPPAPPQLPSLAMVSFFSFSFSGMVKITYREWILARDRVGCVQPHLVVAEDGEGSGGGKGGSGRQQGKEEHVDPHLGQDKRYSYPVFFATKTNHTGLSFVYFVVFPFVFDYCLFFFSFLFFTPFVRSFVPVNVCVLRGLDGSESWLGMS